MHEALTQAKIKNEKFKYFGLNNWKQVNILKGYIGILYTRFVYIYA